MPGPFSAVALRLDLRNGDGYVALNDRWLDGRTRFTGDRVMLRLADDPLPTLSVQGFPSTPVGYSPHLLRRSL
jgi:hypothetical protein